VGGYLITESPTLPAAGWSVAAPTAYSASNVSTVFGSPLHVIVDMSAPTAGSLIAANVTTSGGTSYSFTVTFSDNLVIDSASLDAGDMRAPRPIRLQHRGTWDIGDNGTYTLALEANQVTDTAGNPIGATTLCSFLVSLNYSDDLKRDVCLPAWAAVRLCSSRKSTHGQVHFNCIGAFVGSDGKCLCYVRKREAVRHELRYGNFSAGNQINSRLKIRRHAAIAVAI